MNILPFVSPVNVDELNIFDNSDNPSLLLNTTTFLQDDSAEPNLDDYAFAIIGIPEGRNSYRNKSCQHAPDEIRRQLYRLYCWNTPVPIIDLGNLKIGKNVEDTYLITAELLAFLIENKVIPIILGGSNDIAYANYLAYKKLEQVVNVVAVDSRFDLGDESKPFRSDGYLHKVILDQPNFLLNYSNIGYQTYMNSQEEIELMEKLFLDAYRVGMMRQDLIEVEAIVRNADMMSLDISAVRRPDAPGCPNNSANGFYGEEICQVARYAGLNDKLSSFGIYEFDPTLDRNDQTAQLISHIIWYLIEGYINRPGDTTFKNKNNYIKYSVTVSQAVDELTFYCSKKTRRWWVVVPILSGARDVKQDYFLPCTEKDYEIASQDKIPDRWWKTYNKLNH